MSTENYTVELDKSAAWSLVYRDGTGEMGFCFEPGEEKKRVYLNPRPSVGKAMPEESFYATYRYALAVERTKQYLMSCGYEVAIDK